MVGGRKAANSFEDVSRSLASRGSKRVACSLRYPDHDEAGVRTHDGVVWISTIGTDDSGFPPLGSRWDLTNVPAVVRRIVEQDPGGGYQIEGIRRPHTDATRRKLHELLHELAARYH